MTEPIYHPAAFKLVSELRDEWREKHRRRRILREELDRHSALVSPEHRADARVELEHLDVDIEGLDVVLGRLDGVILP